MSTIKIALVQKKAIPNNKNGNLELAVQYIKEASCMGADIVLFQKCGLTDMLHRLMELLTIRPTLLLKKNAKNGLKVLSQSKATM